MICENNIYIKSKNDPVCPVLLLLGTNHYFSGGGGEKFTGTNGFFFQLQAHKQFFCQATVLQTIFFL